MKINTIDISIIINTCNRPKVLPWAIDSVLQNEHPNYELVIVDQSDDEETKNLVEDYMKHDNRIRYIYYPIKGSSRARNRGVKESKAEIIAFTDDDCLVPKDWIKKILIFFDRYSDIKIVFGKINRGEFGKDGVFVYSHTPINKKLTRHNLVSGVDFLEGNMAVKRDIFNTMRGFDELMGAGAVFKSSEGHDLAYKMLLKGYNGYDTNYFSVTHNGAWNFSKLLRGLVVYNGGVTGFYMKHIRCGDFFFFHRGWIAMGRRLFRTVKYPFIMSRFVPRSTILILRIVYNFGISILLVSLSLFGMLQGIATSFRYSVDKRARQYIE